VIEEDVTVRGRWMRTYIRLPDEDHGTFRYYWCGIRVPWLAWALFS
jgi:hypothetical protein